MNETVVRPSLKLVRAGYTLVVAIIVLSVMLYNNSETLKGGPSWIPLILLVLLAFPLNSHLRRKFIKLVLQGDKLRYESGMLRRSTRLLRISKVQDVRIDQTLPQRLLGVGTITIELMGEESGVTMPSIDHPERVAHVILEAAGRSTEKGDGE